MKRNPPGYVEPGTPCKNCGKREATRAWVGQGGTLGLAHGFYEPWCDVCVLEKQVDHAVEAAARVPELRRLLREARDKAKPLNPGGARQGLPPR